MKIIDKVLFYLGCIGWLGAAFAGFTGLLYIGWFTLVIPLTMYFVVKCALKKLENIDNV